MKPVEPTLELQPGWERITWGKDQPEYHPLPSLRGPGPEFRVLTEWELTDDELMHVIETKRIRLTQLTFTDEHGQPAALQPVLVEVVRPEELDCGARAVPEEGDES